MLKYLDYGGMSRAILPLQSTRVIYVMRLEIRRQQKVNKQTSIKQYLMKMKIGDNFFTRQRDVERVYPEKKRLVNDQIKIFGLM